MAYYSLFSAKAKSTAMNTLISEEKQKTLSTQFRLSFIFRNMQEHIYEKTARISKTSRQVYFRPDARVWLLKSIFQKLEVVDARDWHLEIKQQLENLWI